MSYIKDRERIVFLHFLNREASEASGVFRDAKNELRVLDILTVTHCSNLSVNISQMLEYTIDRPELVIPLSALCKSGILVTTSHDKSYDEFIASRQKLYQNVSGRYPIYFQDTSAVQEFTIRQKNSFSMTAVLRRDILDISDKDIREPELRMEQRHAHDEDWRIFSEKIDPVQRVFGSNRHAAITKGNLAHFSNTKEFLSHELSAIARVISARYFDHYKKHNAAVTCTGIGDIGFIEDFDLFPHYDIPILSSILRSLSWEKLRNNNLDLREQIYDSYGGRSHVNFVANFQSFIGACSDAERAKSNFPAHGIDYFTSLRARVRTLCSHLIYSSIEGERAIFRNIEDFYDRSADIIQRAIERQSGVSPEMISCWEKLMNVRDRSKILLITATDTEDDAVNDALQTAGFTSAGYVKTETGICTRHTLGQNREIVCARSSAGSIGASGSELVVAEAIRDLKPDYLIAVGICFGLKPSKEEQRKVGICSTDSGQQSLGDILYSEKVVDYETVRVCFEAGESTIRERGFRVPAGSALLDAARIARGDYRTGKISVFPGELLSGLKLLDSPPSVDELKRRFPDAVGGEMEASGLVAASLRHGVRWMVVKAICDWGYSKGKKVQKQAAENAAEFAMKMISILQGARNAR